MRPHAAPKKGGDEKQAWYVKAQQRPRLDVRPVHQLHRLRAGQRHWSRGLGRARTQRRVAPAWPRNYNCKPARANEVEPMLHPRSRRSTASTPATPTSTPPSRPGATTTTTLASRGRHVRPDLLLLRRAAAQRLAGLRRPRSSRRAPTRCCTRASPTATTATSTTASTCAGAVSARLRPQKIHPLESRHRHLLDRRFFGGIPAGAPRRTSPTASTASSPPDGLRPHRLAGRG